MAKIMLYTIGFTKKSAEEFFGKIKDAGVKKVIDIRLNNVSQLAGFAKRDDLRYFLKTICNCDYEHQTVLSPLQELLDDWQGKKIDWPAYTVRFSQLIAARPIKDLFSIEDLRDSCLLCAEPTAEHCHRRLVAEHFKELFPEIGIKHL